MNSRVSGRIALPLMVAAVSVVSVPNAYAQRRSVMVPSDTVVRVKLDQELSSRSAARGEKFTATLSADDRSGFPDRTRFEGVVRDVQRKTDDRPGVLDVDFRRVLLPDGRSVAINGQLASLSESDVQRTANGRLAARSRSGGNSFDWKWVGYGAAGGAVLGEILGGNFVKGAILGGLGGAVYGYLNRNKDRNNIREAVVDRGSEFGIRLDQRVVFNHAPTYRYSYETVGNRRDRVNDRYNDRYDDRYDDRTDTRVNRPRDRYNSPNERVLGSRIESRLDNTRVYLDGRMLDAERARPTTIEGVVYVPLAPIADAAGWRYDYRRGEDRFVLHGPRGTVRGDVDSPTLQLGTRGIQRLEVAPVMLNGEIYVPTEYLSRAADMQVNWDRRTGRLDLETDGYIR